MRSGKGNKDRVTTFSTGLIPQLKDHLQRVQLIHDKDLLDRCGCVYLPHALTHLSILDCAKLLIFTFLSNCNKKSPLKSMVFF